jgi:preprotein translocase subunit SecE
MFQRIIQFLKEVKLETSKVTWPSLQELRESTIVVIIAVTVISIGVALVDRILGYVIRFLI